MFRKFSIVLAALLVVVFAACKKKAVQDPVPYQTVYVKLYPNDPLNFKIQAIGGWLYVNGGVNGIIVYRKSNTDFIALERTSTYFPNDAGALAKVRADNFTCKDTVSNSEWQIIDGAVTKGPASLPLKQYHTSYDGNLLTITN
jgi:hypothetical protein